MLFAMQRFNRRTKRLLLGAVFPLFFLASLESVRADCELYTEKPNWSRVAPAHQPLGNLLRRPSPDWGLATLLFGAIGALLLLHKALVHRQPTNNADLAGRASDGRNGSGEPRGLPPALISQRKVTNEGMNDAANHSPR